MSKLTGLESLCLKDNKLTDAGLSYLSKLTGLQELNLAGCFELTDAGLVHLVGLTDLHSLDLETCVWLTDKGILGLKHLPNLRKVNFPECYVCVGENLHKWFSEHDAKINHKMRHQNPQKASLTRGFAHRK